MLLEIESASNFITMLVGKTKVSKRKRKKLQQEIVNVMQKRYKDHWYPEKPHKGTGYRCIRVNKKLDPVLVQACYNCGINYNDVFLTLPTMKIWIDPFCVSYQIGNDGQVCTLYPIKENDLSSPWTLKSKSVKSGSQHHEHAESSFVCNLLFKFFDKNFFTSRRIVGIKKTPIKK